MEKSKPKTTELVSLIASGYEWQCPNCGTHCVEIEYVEIVVCSNSYCGESHYADNPEHAIS